MVKRCCRIYDFLIIDATAPYELSGEKLPEYAAYDARDTQGHQCDGERSVDVHSSRKSSKRRRGSGDKACQYIGQDGAGTHQNEGEHASACVALEAASAISCHPGAGQGPEERDDFKEQEEEGKGGVGCHRIILLPHGRGRVAVGEEPLQKVGAQDQCDHCDQHKGGCLTDHLYQTGRSPGPCLGCLFDGGEDAVPAPGAGPAPSVLLAVPAGALSFVFSGAGAPALPACGRAPAAIAVFLIFVIIVIIVYIDFGQILLVDYLEVVVKKVTV